MSRDEVTPLPIGVRVYPIPDGRAQRRARGGKKRWRRPKAMFVFDTETRVDPTQRLTFGSYRFIDDGKCLEEGLFYGGDLPKDDLAVLEAYATGHVADTDPRLGVPQLKMLSRAELLERLYTAAVDGRCLLVGFNLPFDLSRIAASAGAARGRFNGGFSFLLWQYEDAEGRLRENSHRPRVTVKHIDSKRALKGFTSTRNPDPVDLIPEGSETGEPDPRYGFRGHFLDLRTLAFALTDRGHSLESACEAFGVEHGKIKAETHGIVSEAYIDYNRRDVRATTELAFKLLEEYDRHPIALQETKAYSPASIGKGYLGAKRIPPILERQPRFPKRYLGYAQSAFYGGRTSAHIRKIPVPVVYCDFLSMYPTVNALMGLWRFVIAKQIRIVPNCKYEIDGLLKSISIDGLFDPDTWRTMPAFARVVPNGDVLPTRAKYSLESNDWQVGLNYLYAASDDPKDALWYALPDIVASVLLTGKVPRIVDAFRIEPNGQLPGLQSVKLRGMIEIDPREQDFFRSVIEERKRYAKRTDLPDAERARLDKFIKVLANATSYGIFAQMDRQEASEKVPVTCYGIDARPFQCRVAHPEAPGEHCFPPLASLITAAARLMLALLERCVTDLGGTYAMEDTDSMAIVATERGGLVPCAGGPYRTRNGQEAIRTLSWPQVRAIANRFAQLNPYDRSAIPGSILKIEDDNFDAKTEKQRQLLCLAISAKRYALFLRDRNGDPVLLCKGVNNAVDRCSEHGLGHLLNPTDPGAEDRSWIAQAWLAMIRRSLGLRTRPLGFEKRVAVGRITVSSPAVLRPLGGLNAGNAYANQIKPFNFILSCHVRPLGHPIDADPERFHLIAPYETDPRRWDKLEWIDQYSARRYRIATAGAHGSRSVARVKSYGEVLREYEFHPEAKCADTTLQACGKQSVGLLQRRHIRIDGARFIGKESNHLEEVEEHGFADAASVYAEYPDPQRDEWVTKVLPVIKAMPMRELQERSGMSRAALQAIRAGRLPHRCNQALLKADLESKRPAKMLLPAAQFDDDVQEAKKCSAATGISRPGRENSNLMTSYDQLVANLGFTQDPFASWDADAEERLEDYFIDPPFFNAVFGEPDKASAAVVFAPRGGGKSALRRKIELNGESNGILCVPYTTFPTDKIKLTDINLDYHLKRVVVLILVSLIGYLVDHDRHRKLLSVESRRSLYWLIKDHLSNLQQSDLRAVIDDVKTMSQKGRDWWNGAARIANPILSTVTTALGVAAPEFTLFQNDQNDLGPLSEQLKFLAHIANEASIKSIYILIDRIDEIELTGNHAAKAFRFIAPLLKNLTVLQTPSVGFKAFLWDMLRSDFRAECRADRIKTFDLDWKHDQIKQMIASRLKAYSSGKHDSLKSLVSFEDGIDLDDLIAFLAHGSPRNWIRICQEILVQQSEENPNVASISRAAFVNGVNVFAKKRAEEIIPEATLRDLQKVGRLDFTVLYMYREVFKVTQQAGLQKIQSWKSKGIVKQLGTLKESSGSISNHYVILDPIVGKYIAGPASIFKFVEDKIRKCPKCNTNNVRDWDRNKVQACLECQRDLDSELEGKSSRGRAPG